MKNILSSKACAMLFLSIIVFCLAACNGVSIKPTSTQINGEYGKYFEVVDKSYSLRNNKFSVEFKKIAEWGPDVSFLNPFTVDLMDENGNVLGSNDIFETDYDGLSDLEKLAVGETASITFSFKTPITDLLSASQFKVKSK